MTSSTVVTDQQGRIVLMTTSGHWRASEQEAVVALRDHIKRTGEPWRSFTINTPGSK